MESKKTKFVVIGSGPSGILISYLLLKQGESVTLLEAGQYHGESNLITHESYEFETLSKLPNSIHMVGGGSNQWLGRVGEFKDYDYESHKSRPQKWPYSSVEMQKYFRQVYKYMLNDSSLDDEFIDSTEELKLIKSELPAELELRLFRFSNLEVFQETLKLLESFSNFYFLTGTFCSEILPSSKRGYDLKILNHLGESYLLNSEKIIIAAGTLQSTALLLRSKKLNLSSNNRKLGYYLMEHFDGYIAQLTISRKDKKLLRDFSLSVDRTLNGNNYGVAFSLKKFIIQENGFPNLHFEITRHHKKLLFDSRTYIFNLPIALKSFLFFIERVIRKVLDLPIKFYDIVFNVKRYSIWIKGEEFPFFDSKISLSNLMDQNSVPKTNYHHLISDETSRKIREEIIYVKKILKEHKLGKLTPYRHLMSGRRRFYVNPNWHPMGSTVMGNNSTDSVCNYNLEVHEHKNIFLLSAGVFPTGSNQNPTAMVLAQAFRLAEHLSKNDDNPYG